MKHFVTILLLTAFAANRAASAAVRDSTADAVLGQVNFNQNGANQPGGTPTATNLALSNAAHLAVAPNGRLYVSDADNNRVLSWPSSAAFSTGQTADMVLGQPNFTSGDFGLSATGFGLPQGLSVDANGDLWVADAFNSRVLKFVNPPATDVVADLVIGQPDFVSGDPNLGRGPVDVDVASADSLCFPGRVLAVPGWVIVSDSGNSRVVAYPTPTVNKPDATRVWGQFGSFTCRAKNNDGACQDFGPTTPRSLFNPIGLAVSGHRLYVADWNNNRIVWYENWSGADDEADGVIGQADLFGSACNSFGLGPASICQAVDIAVGTGGELLVADSGNNRALAFHTPIISGEAAMSVFGQLDNFGTADPNHGLGAFSTDADGLFGPTGIAMDAGRNVLAVDTLNQRVLRFDRPLRPAPRPGGTGTPQTPTSAQRIGP
jgi:sugar lactone lactonase YvrE